MNFLINRRPSLCFHLIFAITKLGRKEGTTLSRFYASVKLLHISAHIMPEGFYPFYVAESHNKKIQHIGIFVH